jgi:drug/metabolite transporter (DMT)-like permease
VERASVPYAPSAVPAPAAPRTLLATAAALVGFAANSLLCRAALEGPAIDAWSFTALRLGSGAAALVLLARLVGGGRARVRGAGSFASALALWLYAAAFSLAYLRLGAAVGALVLFASVQATMIGWSVARGVRPTASERAGLAVAVVGLVVLTWPGTTLPDPAGLALMAVAGAAWGAYSLRGRGSAAPLAATADNFVRSVPLALGAWAAASLASGWHVSGRGVVLAVLSGAVASGLGYCAWYVALPRLSAVRAAVVQLLVPVLAAGAAVVVLGERLGWRLLVAGPLILMGVGVAVLRKRGG